MHKCRQSCPRPKKVKIFTFFDSDWRSAWIINSMSLYCRIELPQNKFSTKMNQVNKKVPTLVGKCRFNKRAKSNLLQTSPSTTMHLVNWQWEGRGWRGGESARLPPMWPGFDSRTRGPFLESPGNFSGPLNCFMFAQFAFKIDGL